MPDIGLAGEAGTPFGALPALLLGVVAAVDDPNIAVVAQAVVGGDALETRLEAVIEASDLVPLAEIVVDAKSVTG